jgi:hypothetical protein
MNKDLVIRMKALEGHRVSLALRDGTRIDECQLVSTGRHSTRTLWVFATGSDTFVPLDDVVDLWEPTPPHRRVA